MAKYRETTPTTPKVIGAHLLKFKPILDPLEKICKGDPRSRWGVLARLGHSLAHVKIRSAAPPRGRNMVFRKKRSRWVQFHLQISKFTGLKFTGLVSPNAGKIAVQVTYPILNIFIRFGDICRRTLKSSEIGQNFACFWPLKFFGGGPCKIMDGIMKFGLVLITAQNFAPIGRRISEIPR